MRQEFEHPFVVDFVEKTFDIGFNDMAHTLLPDGPSQLVQTPVSTALGSVSVAAVFKSLLIDRFQDSLYRQLHQLVFEAADPKGAAFGAARFGYIGSSLWLGPVPHILEPTRQVF